MVAFGAEVGLPYLLCSNHTINLAVSKDIFQEPIPQQTPDFELPPPAESQPAESVNINDDEEGDSVSESEDSSSDDDDDHDSDSDYNPSSQVAVAVVAEPPPMYINTIAKMRDIIKMFRRSPLKSGILEGIQQRGGVKPLKLLNDVPTRWNSLVIAGRRFLQILPHVVQALKHRDIKSKIVWNDFDTEVLTVMLFK